MQFLGGTGLPVQSILPVKGISELLVQSSISKVTEGEELPL